MGKALYRSYRPRSFGEVFGQDHITKTLQNAIKGGKLSHAYLFTGPRGVGKTSVARILAHEINRLPYSDESIHLDIIEIDAASNRRIDEIRDLRDKVRIAPTSAKYKVYIIDEVHMLTREAFNALLKTLEEPPAHCVFILATTEAHKLPETIISRTQRFEFKPVSPGQAAKHLESISKQEKINIDPKALDLLAEFGSGSFRDSISYLDQLSAFNKTISEDDVREVLGLPASKEIDNLLNALESNNSSSLLGVLKKLEEKGVSSVAIAGSLSSKLRQKALLNKINRSEVELLSQLVNISASSRPQEVLEVTLLGYISQSNDESQPAKTASLRATVEVSKKPLEKAIKQKPVSKTDFSLEFWGEVVSRSKQQAASLYTALRLAQPSYKDGVLILGFQFPLHQKKLLQAKNKDMVAKIIEEISGSQVTVVPELLELAQPVPQIEEQDHDQLNSISHIFGGAEVLEA